MIQNCNEQFLDDVIRIDIVPASRCDIAVPFQEPVTETDGTKTVGADIIDRIGEPALTVAYNIDADEEATGQAENDEPASLSQDDKYRTAGVVVAHTLKVPVIAGFESVRAGVNALHGIDFHIVLHTADGSRYLCYGLPGSCDIRIQEAGTLTSMTVNATLQSMSHVILLVDPDAQD